MEIVDDLVVAVAGFVAAAFFVPHLGFYSDDWVLLAACQLAPDQSLVSLFLGTHAQHFASRPTQGLYSLALCQAFGRSPLGYHTVNTLVLAAGAVLLRSVLARVGAPRLGAVTAGIAFACTPAYSTDRFWFAAFAAPLSVTLYLASLRIDLAAIGRRGAPLIGSRIVSLATLSIGLLAYELALPLALLSPLVAWSVARREGQTPWRAARWIAWIAPLAAVLLALGGYKAVESGRLGPVSGEPGRMARILSGVMRLDAVEGDYGLNAWRAVTVNLGDHGLLLPTHAWSLRHRSPGPALPVVAFLTALAAAGYLRGLGRHEQWRPGPWRGLTVAGVAVFMLGYAIFLTNSAIQITPTGVGNRSALAASLGSVMVLAGALGWLVSALPLRSWRSLAYSSVFAVYVGSAVFTTVALSSYWAESYPRQLAVIDDIKSHLPMPAPKTTLFLGGVCAYAGPAVVFESSWDLAFALRIAYHDPTISADVVSASFTPKPGHITTRLYEEDYDWPYGPDTLLYDARTHRSYPLLDQRSTQEVLRRTGLPSAGCPPAREGVGVSVFP